MDPSILLAEQQKSQIADEAHLWNLIIPASGNLFKLLKFASLYLDMTYPPISQSVNSILHPFDKLAVSTEWNMAPFIQQFPPPMTSMILLACTICVQKKRSLLQTLLQPVLLLQMPILSHSDWLQFSLILICPFLSKILQSVSNTAMNITTWAAEPVCKSEAKID